MRVCVETGMKTLEKLTMEVYADLVLATTVGHLSHLELDLHPFTGLDEFKRPRFKMDIPMRMPAFQEYGAQTFSIMVPWDAAGNRVDRGESASVVEIAPLRYGGALFDSPSEHLKDGVTHPMLCGDQIERFRYPAQMLAFHSWIITFCVTRRSV